MTEPVTPDVPALPKGPPDPGSAWGRLFLAMMLVGGAFAWLVSNFSNVQPVLEHPITMLIWTWLCFMMGGSAVYVLIYRPLERNFQGAQDVIRRLREREREWLTERGDLRSEIAELRTRVEFLSGEVEHLRQARAPPASESPG